MDFTAPREMLADIAQLVEQADDEAKSKKKIGRLSKLYYSYGKQHEGEMTEEVFLKVLNDYDECILNDDMKQTVFNALDIHKRGKLSHSVFSVGMYVFSPSSPQRLQTLYGKFRLRLIFAFFDKDGDALLNKSELRHLLICLHKTHIHQPISNIGMKKLETRTEDETNILLKRYPEFCFNCFYKCVVKKVIKSTNLLIQCNQGLEELVLRNMKQHLVNCEEFQKIKEIQYKSKSVDGESVNSQISKETKSISHEYAEKIVNSCLQIYKQDISGSYRHPNGCDLVLTYQIVQTLCDAVKYHLQTENSLLEVDLPALCFGNVNGCLIDILEFLIRVGWGDANFFLNRNPPMKIIFCGNFVDVGDSSLETICFIFSLKILYPNSVFLLRGKHEDPHVNFRQNFYNQIYSLEYTSDYENIWAAFNETFDYLSLAAIVGQKILFLHGGIGRSITKIFDLRDLQKPIGVVHKEGIIYDKKDIQIKDCLYSYPLCDNRFGYEETPDKASFCFGSDVTYKFLKENGLELILSTTDNTSKGFTRLHEGGVLCINSSQTYGSTPSAVYISEGKDGRYNTHTFRLIMKCKKEVKQDVMRDIVEVSERLPSSVNTFLQLKAAQAVQ